MSAPVKYRYIQATSEDSRYSVTDYKTDMDNIILSFNAKTGELLSVNILNNFIEIKPIGSSA